MGELIKTIIDWFFHEEHLYYDIVILLVLVVVLMSAVIAGFAYNRKLKRTTLNLKRVSDELMAKNIILEEIATSDKMTGIRNRTYFDQRLYEEMATMDRYGGQLSLLFFDLDNFKRVNDTHGHNVGDEVLIKLSETIQKMMRKTDIFARWGGEEFVVLLPGTPMDGAEIFAEKIRKTAEELDHPDVGQVTISIGMSQRHLDEDRDSWFKRTDSALYRAKAEGRNRVCLSHYKDAYIHLDLKWQPRFVSGHAELDKQHKLLFEIGNELRNATLNDFEKEILIEQMDRLMDHVVYHFKYEEEVLNNLGYNGYEEHVKIHNHLLKKAQELRTHLIKDRISPVDAFEFVVSDIILKHLIHEDAKYFTLTKV